MPDFITLSCPSCGNKLQITSDIDRFACAACGNEHIVNRSGGIVTLKPVIDSIQKVQLGVDKTASELAIVRLEKEIDALDFELYNVRNQPIDSGLSWISNWKIWIFAFLLIVIGIIVYTSPARSGAKNPGEVEITGVIIGGLGLVLLIILPIIKSSGEAKRKESVKKIEKEAKPIKDKLVAKKRELARHQEIVSKYK